MPSTAEIQAAEGQYTEHLTALYETLLDLNVSMSTVAQQSMELMGLRDGLLDMYGVASAPARAARQPQPPQPKKPKEPALTASMAGQFRMKLQDVASKRAGKQPLRDDFVFDTAFTVEDKSYVSTLDSVLLNNGPYRGGAPEVTKKGAEQAACEAALRAEFPEVHAQMEALGAGPDRGIKRRLIEDPVITNSKGKLCYSLSLLFERSLAKEDIVYASELGEGGFVSTVTCPNVQGVKKYTGSAASNKKDAEASAADACLSAMTVQFAAAQEQHRAKKLKKRAEAVAALEAKRVALEGK